VFDAVNRFAVHVLDMGSVKYGDCIVVEAGGTRVLVDGGHPGDWRSGRDVLSIPEQIGKVLDPTEVDRLHHFDQLSSRAGKRRLALRAPSDAVKHLYRTRFHTFLLKQ